MAKDIGTTPGIGTDADFLNNNKLVDGATKVNTIVHQDITQFFQKLMDIAGLTPNGNFDNEVNGYQFLTAANYAIARRDESGIVDTNGTGWRRVAKAEDVNGKGSCIINIYRDDLTGYNIGSFLIGTSQLTSADTNNVIYIPVSGHSSRIPINGYRLVRDTSDSYFELDFSADRDDLRIEIISLDKFRNWKPNTGILPVGSTAGLTTVINETITPNTGIITSTEFKSTNLGIETDWVTPTLNTGFGAPAIGDHIKYRINPLGYLEITGGFSRTTGTGTPFTLSVGYRPPNDTHVPYITAFTTREAKGGRINSDGTILDDGNGWFTGDNAFNIQIPLD